MHIERVSPALGARVSGLDIEHPGEAECSALRAALPLHGVLFLHAPAGRPRALLDLARIFGEPLCNPHPFQGRELQHIRCRSARRQNDRLSQGLAPRSQEYGPRIPLLRQHCRRIPTL